MKPKVLYTASTYSHLWNFHRPYLAWFRRQGWEVHTAAGGDPGDLPEADQAVELPFAKRMTAPSNFRCAALLGARMRREGYELVVANTALASFFTRLPLLGWKDRPRVVNLVHGYLFDADTPLPKRQVLLSAERLTAPCTDLLLTMNQSDLALARHYSLGRQVLPVPGVGVPFGPVDAASKEEGFRLRADWDIPQDAFLLVYPAEFSRRKSQETLIRALARLPERVWLLLPGQGDLWGSCQDLAQSLGVAGRVRFPGQMPNIPVCLQAADCAVSASRSEGLPFNVMEAMRAGLPIAASDVKGHRDLLGDGCGVLYPYGDPAALAAAVGLLLEDPDYRRKLGRAARAASEAYGLDQVFPQVTGALCQAAPELLAPAGAAH